jgi:hypothetical protein
LQESSPKTRSGRRLDGNLVVSFFFSSMSLDCE